MEARSLLRLLTGASLISALVAMMGGRAPRWLRIMLVVSIVAVALGVGLYTYKYLSRPTTVSVAVGSVDGDVSKVLQSLATKMAAANSPVRLKIIDKGTARAAAKAFSDGESDLAIVRSDLPGLSNARTLLLVTHGVVLIVVPPGSPIDSVADLKGKTVGVLGGEINQRLTGVLARELDLGRVNVQFRDLAAADVQQAVAAKQIQALLLVVPVSEKYLALLRSMFPGTAKQKMGLIPIESAEAIATISREYESYELPKGTVKGAPPIPEDDLTTLRVPFYLVARKTMSDDLAGAITKTVMDARRDLASEFPLLANIGEPNTEKDAFIPIHPGAATYFDGDQKTIFDKYGDQFFYGSMLLGGLMSILAATWNFMTAANPAPPEQRPLNRLYALTERIRRASSEAELAEIEQCIDDIVKDELDKYAEGRASANEAAALSLATHRVEYLIDRVRASLARPARRHQAS